MLPAAVAVLAIVAQNPVSLRAAPRESAPQQAVLWAGDTLEIRGERAGYVQVYDHRRERAGYVRTSQVRELGLAESDAPALLAVVRFLRDTPGSEALGIGYGAAFLKAAPARALSAEPFDAIGQMADRLAQRASSPQLPASAAAIAAHLEVVGQYGIAMKSFERNGTVQVCYDGEMFRRSLAQPAVSPDQAARAALGLTRPECIDPALTPALRYDLEHWRAQVLDRVPAQQVSEPLRSRVHLRRAGVWAALAFAQTRRGEPAAQAGERSIAELASADKNELGDEDLGAYAEAAIRVGASRWAAAPGAAPTGRLVVRTTPGAPGETCVSLYEVRRGDGEPLARRCTYGTVWAASATANPGATALALAVQPLESWRELWLFRRVNDGWRVEVVPPASLEPELGYVEFAGWVPGGERLLIARDVRTPAGARRRFEVLRLDTLATEHQASSPQLLAAFIRWQDPSWKRDSVALR